MTPWPFMALCFLLVTSPAWPADFAERWPHPDAIDPAPPFAIVPPAIVERHAPPDICARHGMHKVVTRGGKSWRCRH